MSKVAPFVIAVFVLALIGCQQEGPTSPEENGKLFLGFSLKAVKGVGATATRVNVSISKDAFADSLDLTVSADSAWGTFTNLLPGVYTILVKVYDGTTLLGTGSGQGTVVSGQTVIVRITVNLNSGNLQVVVDWNITSSITLSGRWITGLAYDSGFLWAIHQPIVFNNTFKIAKIDPSSRQVVLQSGDIGDNGRGITVGAGALWVSMASADVINKFDPATFVSLARFNTPGSEPSGVAFDGTSLWLADAYFGRIYKLNTSGSVLSSFTIPNAFRSGLEWENGGLWATTDTNKVSLYTTGGTITSTKTLQLPAGYYPLYDIAIGGGKVFISSRDKIFIQTWQ